MYNIEDESVGAVFENLVTYANNGTQTTNGTSSKFIKPYFKKPDFALYNEDSLEILSRLPDNYVDMIFADPPYMLSNDGFTCQAGRMVSVNKGKWERDEFRRAK